MKIDRVTYQKIFPIDAYVNQRVGFEASIDEGEDVYLALDKLMETADNWNESRKKETAENLPIIHVDYGQTPHYQIKNLKDTTNGEEKK